MQYQPKGGVAVTVIASHCRSLRRFIKQKNKSRIYFGAIEKSVNRITAVYWLSF
jgi:hypothetical protein